MSKRQIQVWLIDASMGKVFAESLMPPESLPKTFELKTTLHIGEDDWQVIKAEPMTAAEFTRTGKLVITLEKVMRMPTKSILYTLPTICDEIPIVQKDASAQDSNIFRIHEDFWRQVELVSGEHKGDIEAEFKEITRIFHEESVDNGQLPGFKKIHLRKRIKTPLQCNLSLNDLYSIFPNSLSQYDGLSYLQAEGVIEGGFAFDIGPLVVYGQELDSRVRTLCMLRGQHQNFDSLMLASALDKIMAAHVLYLVDWCRVQRIATRVADIQSYLERNFY